MTLSKTECAATGKAVRKRRIARIGKEEIRHRQRAIQPKRRIRIADLPVSQFEVLAVLVVLDVLVLEQDQPAIRELGEALLRLRPDVLCTVEKTASLFRASTGDWPVFVSRGTRAFVTETRAFPRGAGVARGSATRAKAQPSSPAATALSPIAQMRDARDSGSW